MHLTVKEIAAFVEGKIVGIEDKLISNVAKIEEAKSDDLSFLYQDKFEKYLNENSSFTLLVKKDFTKSFPNLTLIKVGDPYLAFIKIIEKYFVPQVELPPLFDLQKNQPVNFSCGKNFRCGSNVFIGKHCKIGNDVTIFSNVTILDNAEVGDDSIIYPNVTIRERCKIGKRNILHPGVVIGGDGFGYYKNPDKSYRKIPQIGIVVLEDDVEIGSNTAIDRATVGETRIKRGTKLDNLVQVGHNVVLGEDCAVSGQTGFAGSTKVGNRLIAGGQVGFADHLNIEDDVIAMAQSGIANDLKKGKAYFGSPAIEARESMKLNAIIKNLPALRIQVMELQKKVDELTKKLDEQTGK
ncbi:MAG: UDP-3-O-(3-hydroxymyristoyl)glucosamine N-acyltransferase [Ignavibacteria bacterium]|nr:UDP-3-O-(3-hydroxymyristoyl)glucosamine N-acyltransferase [Ignavibacteria bacterium]